MCVGVVVQDGYRPNGPTLVIDGLSTNEGARSWNGKFAKFNEPIHIKENLILPSILILSLVLSSFFSFPFCSFSPLFSFFFNRLRSYFTKFGNSDARELANKMFDNED